MAESATGLVERAPSAGRALPGWRAVLLVTEHFWVWYRRNWRATFVGSVLQPLLFLVAFGLGFGALVAGSPTALAATGGVPYLVYLAPGLLAMSAVQTAGFESTYPVLSGFKWSRIYHGVVASPITPEQAGMGHLTWIVLRMLSSGAIYVLVIAAFGGVTGPAIVFSLLAATLCGAAFASPVMAFAATVQNEGGPFSVLFRFVVIPMTLFAGTFFPVSALPAFIQPIAWITPLWHGTELARGAVLGTLSFWPAVGHVAYLVAMLAAGIVLLRWRFRKRLTS
jgi:lipooligosaccharide transport system permease protein